MSSAQKTDDLSSSLDRQSRDLPRLRKIFCLLFFFSSSFLVLRDNHFQQISIILTGTADGMNFDEWAS